MIATRTSPVLATRPALIVIGGSAGGIDALMQIFSGLPANYPIPMAIVIHLQRRRASVLAGLLCSTFGCDAREAVDKEPIVDGVRYVAPPDYHLLVDDGPSIALSVEPPVNFSIPSIDVLFESAAAVCGANLIGIVLSGANDDGAKGLRAIEMAGGVCVAQSPDQAVVRTMPVAALDACQSARSLTANEIARLLCSPVVFATEPPESAR